MLPQFLWRPPIESTTLGHPLPLLITRNPFRGARRIQLKQVQPLPVHQLPHQGVLFDDRVQHALRRSDEERQPQWGLAQVGAVVQQLRRQATMQVAGIAHAVAETA